jgi:hypothetical protein
MLFTQLISEMPSNVLHSLLHWQPELLILCLLEQRVRSGSTAHPGRPIKNSGQFRWVPQAATTRPLYNDLRPSESK